MKELKLIKEDIISIKCQSLFKTFVSANNAYNSYYIIPFCLTMKNTMDDDSIEPTIELYGEFKLNVDIYYPPIKINPVLYDTDNNAFYLTNETDEILRTEIENTSPHLKEIQAQIINTFIGNKYKVGRILNFLRSTMKIITPFKKYTTGIIFMMNNVEYQAALTFSVENDDPKFIFIDEIVDMRTNSTLNLCSDERQYIMNQLQNDELSILILRMIFND